MACKSVFAVVAVLAAVAAAVPVHVQQQQHQHQLQHAEQPAHYQFSYAVNDEHTGDIKAQHETRQGDHVEGSYELIDSDGFKRIVDYTADEHTGFVATVRREPTHIQIPLPAPVKYVQHAVAPVAHRAYAAAPQHVQHAYATPAPVVYHQQKPAPFAVHHVAATTPAPHVQQYVQPQQPQYVHHQVAQPQLASHQFQHEANHVVFNAPGVNYNF